MRLKMTNAKACCSSSCNFLACIKEFELEDSELFFFHYQGLSACGCLRRLTLYSNSILSSPHNPHQDILFCNDCHIEEPSGLSDLTALEHLSIVVEAPSVRLHLDWLTQLPATKSLYARLEVQQVDCPSGLTMLTNLTDVTFRSKCGQIL